MATLAELEDALRNAHSAGDQNAARKLADEIVRVRQQSSPVTSAAPVTTTPRPNFLAEGTEDIPRMLPKAKSAPPPVVKKIGFDDVVKDDMLFNIAQDYLLASGQPGLQKDESREDLVTRYMSERRNAEISTMSGQVPELMRIVNAPKEKKIAIAKGRDLYEKMADVGEEGGQKGFGPYVDVAKGLASDIPLWLVSAGAGKVGTQAAVRAASKGATEATLRTAGTVGIAGAEAALGGATEITRQRTEQEEAKAFGEEPQELSPVGIGAAMIFGAATAALPLYVDARKAQRVQQSGQRLAEEITARKGKGSNVPTSPTAPVTPLEQSVIDAINLNMDDVHDKYMKIYGASLLEKIDPSNAIADAKIRTELSKAAVRIALQVVKNDPNFQLKPQEQISSALNKVFSSMGEIDNVVLEKALVDSGVTKEQFAAMNKATVSDAARIMQQYSAAAAAFKTLANTDSKFNALIKDIYKFDDDQVGAFTKLNLMQQRVNREWKAFITSGVDTTSRNALSTAIVLPLKTGVKLLEGTAYTIGSTLSKSAKGQRLEVAYKGMGDTIRDSFRVYYYLAQQGLSKDITEKVLQGNPNLLSNINNALQETGDKQVSALARWANSFNVAIDSFTRRGVFVASVSEQLRRQGKNLYTDFLDKDMDIPVDIIKEAMKDSLQTTFSYMPKKNDKTIASVLEREVSSAANDVIRFLDKTPIVNFAVPFPRYMANSMAYLYRYSPVGMMGAAEETAQAFKLAKAGKQEQATLLYRRASEKWVQSAMGIAALASAIDYREKNPDVPWYEVKTNAGTSTDVRGLGTPGSYFAIADIYVRQKQGTLKTKDVKGAIESIVGLKFKAGSGDVFLDRLIRMHESEEVFRQFAIETGQAIGDIAGGFTQPFVVKQVYDFINLIREEGAVVRDPNLIESETSGGAFLEAAQKRLMGKLPIAKEQLPPAVIRLTDDELSREGEYFNRLLGFRQVLQRSPVESEITRLNLDPYELYGSSSGDKNYDRDLINEANKRVKEAVTPIIQSAQYKMLPDVEKNIALSTAVRQQVAEARETVKEKVAAEDLSRIYKMRYKKLSRQNREAINRRYAEDNDGVTLENAKDWFALDKYEAELSGRIGSVTDQSQRLFGR